MRRAEPNAVVRQADRLGTYNRDSGKARERPVKNMPRIPHFTLNFTFRERATVGGDVTRSTTHTERIMITGDIISAVVLAGV